MFQPAFAFVGLRYARTTKRNHFISFINLFSVVGIALGLVALITMSSVMNGFQTQLKNRVLGITPHIVVNAPVDGELTKVLQQSASVIASSPFSESEGVLQSAKDLQGVMIHGVIPDDMLLHSAAAQAMLAGEFTQLKAGEFGLIIGRALAIRLNISLGERVRVISASTAVFSPFGQMYSQRVFRVVGMFDIGSELDDKVVYTHLHDAAKLQRVKPEAMASTRLFLDDAFNYLQVIDLLDGAELSYDTWRARQGPLFDAVKMEKNMMVLMLVLIIAVAAFNIVSALVMLVKEKQGDIAILRTQGMEDKGVFLVFILSGLYNGVKGTIVGLLGGLLVVFSLNPLLSLLNVPIMLGEHGQHLPVDLRLSQVVVLVGLSLLLSFLATLYPAYRALKSEPANALQYE
ncbi:lipoprotein-releasing ABC transporter permease subunit [Aestuariibacter sp. AA17]|uniref:Lipoprotein-releasing ABC transporter permease subunit n=1 Tax=Fluctibacter corallii TaxID=2984329 RepID=A0ABT3AA55_9ALTE|nr:lipoprotein-releasing ABC transporter permease subunit [Aestuariibacter sp. AA17]MCV2885196.1 lipoprotein-releasing ABC transporter permease subunit [Aestuariibacter sp. AA17]